MDVVIRKATWEDAPSMAEIHMRSWEAAYAGMIPDEAIAAKNAGRPDMWRRTLSGEHDDYIAFVDGTPAGLMCLHACRDADLAEAGEVGAFYLRPDRWGMGIGRAMMDYAFDLMRRRGYETVALWVLEGNRRARRFYEKYGFSEDGTRKEVVIGKPLVEVRYRMPV